MSYMRKSLLLVALLASWAAGPLFAEEGGHFRLVDGMSIYIGVLPAEMIRDHRIVHQGREGVTTREQHLVVTVIDQETGQRIENAEVAARIGHEGHMGAYRALEPMKIADTITYGNFFSFPNEGGYNLQIRINRPEAPATEVEFRHRHVAE